MGGAGMAENGGGPVFFYALWLSTNGRRDF